MCETKIQMEINCADIRKQEKMENLLYQLNEFRKKELLTDVVLKASDGTRISAHRNILAAASPFFMAMFCGHFSEREQQEICLPEIDTQCLQLVVEFIYTGMVVITDDCVQQLLQTASFLQLDQLADMCGEHMADLLDPENCLGFKRFAEMQNNPILLYAAKHFVKAHFQEVVQCEEFYEMPFAEMRAWLIPILSRNKLFMNANDTIIKGIVRWAEFNPETRMAHLMELLRFIHPLFVSVDVTRSLTSLQEQSDCAQWLSEVERYEECSDWCIFLIDKMRRNPETCCYDLKTGKLLTLTAPPRPASATSLVEHKKLLYVQGGSKGSGCITNAYCYDIYCDQWHGFTPLQKERSHHRSLILNDCLYAIGGYTNDGITNSVEHVNLTSNKPGFSRPMLMHRSSMGAVVHGNCMYVMGGEEDIRSYNCLERYDPRESFWKYLAPMNGVKGYCSSTVLGDQIYCCEGLGMCMERYDIRANKWEIIDFGEEREFYEIFTVDNQLFAICCEFIARYDLQVSQWNVIHRFPLVRDWDSAVSTKIVT